ncbi:MAG: hypothetical protein IKW31_03715 [Alistipes sp.]|nr:hypothetical protein [Alistipes sp.]
MKARFLALAALVLGLAACQTEPEGLNVNVGGEVDTTITVSLPETTRATDSAEGAFENVNLNEYTIRYILQVYYKDEPSQERLVQYTDGKEVTFDVRLVPGRDYNFVVWADLVEGNTFQENVWNNDDGLHYNTTDLHNITLKQTWVAMDETRDAFTGYFNTADGDKRYSAGLPINITLTRPFAKLRVITTDMVELNNLGITPYKAVATYTTKHYESFNALNGTYAGEVSDISHTYDIVSYGDNVTTGDKQSKVLFTDYFFANNEVVNFTLDVKEENGTSIKLNTFNTPIPAQRNYLTTIQGNILTDGNNVTVNVEDAFKNGSNWNPTEDEYDVEIVEVGNAADLQQVIEEAEVPTTIVLGGDINLGDLFGAGILSTRATAAPLPIVVADGKSLVLELNGYKITTPWEDEAAQKHYYAFKNHGSLTIQDSNSKGNGEIKARGIFNYGTMTLKSGTINACDGNGGYGVRNYEDAEFIMNGGSIVTSKEDGDIPGEGYDATTIRVDEGATATINGGAINNVSNFTVAIDNYGTTTINDGTFTTIHTTIANSASMTINGGSFTCNGLEGVTAHALWAAAGTTTINGGTFDGKDNYNGFNVDADEGAIVNINGGKFLPVHSGSLYGKGTIIVKGGEFFDQIADKYVDYDYNVVKNGEFYTLERKADVAKIGEVGYTSLAKAVAAVQDGETITLVANETFTEKNYYDNGGWKDGLGYAGDKSFTIDLNNKTIGQDGALNDYLIWIKNDGSKANTITLKNGTLDAGTTAYCAFATASSNKQKITINFENVNLVGNNSNGAVAKIRGGAELNVKAGTVITGKNNYVGIEAVGNNTVVNIYDNVNIYQNGTGSYVGAIVGASYNATMNIYGGYGKSAKCGIIVMSTGATINVSGGEWIANNDGTVAADNNAVLVSQNNRYETGWACKSILNVTGGTFKGGYNCYGMGPGVEPNDAQINIKGGNFNANPASYVVAGYESVEENGVYTVAKPKALADFEAAIAKGGNVTLTSDVTLLETIEIENQVVIDLNGKTVTAPLFSAFNSKAGGNLTIKNGKVVAYESTVRAVGGKATIESGEYTSTGTALDSPATYRYSLDCREGGELIINGGTFKSNNGMINVSSTVTINGGKFENIVEKSTTRHFAYVSALLTINDGEFYGKANSSAGGCFFCGAAAGCDIQVNGGKFTSLWTSGSVNRIFEVYYGGKINVTGGMFNTNGGITTFVTENTDEATKAAYPYVAK